MRPARRLTRDGDAQMQCLVGIGGRVEFLIENAKNNLHKLVIGRLQQELRQGVHGACWLPRFHTYLNLTDHGFVKGECPVVDSNIIRASEIAKRSLGQSLGYETLGRLDIGAVFAR